MPDAILTHVPGMRNAPSVPVLEAGILSEAIFVGEYVSNSRPCIVRGAAKHWAAMKKWRSKDYLKARCGHHSIYLIPHEYFLSLKRNDIGKRITTFAEAIDHLHATRTRVAMFATAAPWELALDTSGFHFLGKTERAFTYPPLRYFFYRNGGTTWHYHPFDETLMCQIVGVKKVGLLKVDALSQKAVRDVFLKEDYYDDASAFDGVDNTNLNWLSATLEEGDALYIPQMWWHGVSPVGESCGITAATCWRSPLPVLAQSLKRMAAGEIEMIGVVGLADLERIAEVADELGLRPELLTALRRTI